MTRALRAHLAKQANLTLRQLLAYFERAVARFGVEQCMFDPWNKADHSALTKMGGIEPYLVHTLGLCTKWSQDTGQCLVLTAHPKRAEENMGYGKTRPVPTGGTISGGQTWENMAHYVGAMHRPYDFLEDSTQAAFYCHKCKDERNVAKRGSVGAAYPDGAPPMVPLNWDSISNRYRWGAERWNPLDSPGVAQLWATPEAPANPVLFARGAPAVNAFDAPRLKPLTAASDFDSLNDFNPGGRVVRLPE